MEEQNQPQEHKKQTDNKDFGKKLLGWKFKEFIKHQRSRNWYIVIGAVILLLLIYAVWTKNFLFALIIIIASLTYLYESRRDPVDLGFTIYEDGIEIGDKFYPWKNLDKFWIIYNPPEVKKLYLEFKNKWRPFLSIPIEKENPLKVREALSKYLTEDTEKEDETFSEELSRMLKL